MPDSSVDPKFAELLATRLCHDLTGPIGAVNNGAEFLAEEDFGMQNQAVDLIRMSAVEAVRRLQFYRFAYGRINHSGEACLSDLKKLVQDFFMSGKITLDWPDSHTEAAGISISQKTGRLLLNMVLIASHTLMRGGTLSVRLDREGGTKRVTVSASGVTVKWDEEMQKVLRGEVDINDLSPKTVQLHYLVQQGKALDAAIEIECGESTFTIAATQPEMQMLMAAEA